MKNRNMKHNITGQSITDAGSLRFIRKTHQNKIGTNCGTIDLWAVTYRSGRIWVLLIKSGTKLIPTNERMNMRVSHWWIKGSLGS